MKFSRRVAIYGAVCVTVGAAAGPPLAAAGVDSFKDVVIRNGESQPVPTKAIGTTPVKVTNDGPIEVTSVDAAAASTPMAKNLEFAFDVGKATSLQTVEVPAGKRLELEFFTFHDQGLSALVDQIHVSATTSGERVVHRVATSRQGMSSDVASQPLAISADPGTDVQVYVMLNGSPGGTGDIPSMFGSLSGRLVDA